MLSQASSPRWTTLERSVHFFYRLLNSQLELSDKGYLRIGGKTIRQSICQQLADLSAVDQPSHSVGYSGQDPGGLLTDDTEGVLLTVTPPLFVEYAIAADCHI